MAYNKSLYKEKEFRRWLIDKEKYSSKTAGDYISRCNRIERTLNTRLKKEFSSDNYDNLLSSLKDDVGIFSDSFTHAKNVYTPLISAAMKYRYFLFLEEN